MTIPWFKVDDGFHSHPKTVGLSLEAIGLWTKAGSYCADYLTDGALTLAHVKHLGGTEELADELVEVELWTRSKRGYQFHGWTEFQPTKKDVQADREAAKERMRKAREKRKAAGQAKSEAPDSSEDVRANSAGTSNEVRDVFGQPRPDPSRPDPTNKEEPSEIAEAIPDDSRPDLNDRDDVRALLDHLDQKIQLYDPEARLPSRTKTNADAARLLLDRDGRTVEQVKASIDYAQDTEFWRPNIRSMSKLRTKYDTLRAQAMQDRSGRPSQPRQTAWDRELQVSKERHDRMQSGELSFTPIDRNDPDLWMPKAIEE